MLKEGGLGAGEEPAQGQVLPASLEGGGHQLIPHCTNIVVLTARGIVLFSQGTTSVMCELILEQGPREQ